MATLRRQVKNMVKNYSEAEVKVRDATSNDPWGPSSTLMGEISDLTYNIVALGEVMRMIWKRLNDHGKNWRHVYKSLVLLDYLIKNGNEKVAQQCKEHIVAIQTLKDFQYMEEQKDQGLSVREKAKQLVNLLRDDERLKAERAKAFKARERYAQNAMGISSDNKVVFATTNPARHLSSSGSNRLNSSYSDVYGGATGAPGRNPLSPDLEAVRPSDQNEEDLQIKLAMMLSQQEHEEEQQRKRADDAKLQIALEQSKSDNSPNGLVDLSDNLFNDSWPANGNQAKPASETDDIFSSLTSSGSKQTSLIDPWSNTNVSNSNSNKNGLDPWKTNSAPSNQSTNPWSPNNAATSSSLNKDLNDPWATNSNTNNTINKIDDFDLFSSDRVINPVSSNTNSNDPFGDLFSSTTATTTTTTTNKASTNPWNLSESNQNNINNKTNKFDPFSDFGSNKISDSTAKPNHQNGIRKTPESFLGENSALVNLENLIPTTTNNLANRPKSTNPFSSAAHPTGLTSSSSSGHLNNPFVAQQMSQKGPTINQLQQQSIMSQFGSNVSTPTPPPLIPASLTSGQLAQPLIVAPTSQTPIMPFMSNTSTTPVHFNTQIGQNSLFPNLSSGFNNTNNQPSTTASTNPFLMM